MRLWLLIALVTVWSCDGPAKNRVPYSIITGRDAGYPEDRTPLYRIALPENWSTVEITESVADTKLPIFEARYGNGSDSIRLTVHNFPYDSPANRIPPQAQVNRWKQQLDVLEISGITQQAFAGFVGLHLYAEGMQEGKESAVSAWAMQLAPEHDRTLAHSPEGANTQERSDITIKFTGPKPLVDMHQEGISSIARSFELLNPLPNP